MAFSVGSTWGTVSSSPSLQKRQEAKIWRFIEASKYKWLNAGKGSPKQFPYAFANETKRIMKRKAITHSSSPGESSSTESNTNDLNDITEDGLLKGNSYLKMARSDGKAGFISFYGLSTEIREEIQVRATGHEPLNVFWFVGPTVLVFSLVFPSFYLRRILLTIFEDSLFTDFLILFVTEALFYAGVAIYVFIIDHVYGNRDRVTYDIYGQMKTNFGLRVFSVSMLVLSLVIPLVTMGMVWPWTGPAASATLAPYLVGLVVQFAFEQYARHRKSSAWTLIPIVFQVYRLHQLNRAAQLVTALSFSVRGIETTAQTVAINNSLGTLLNVLQVLGVICIWSLSSFLMRCLPSSPAAPEP